MLDQKGPIFGLEIESLKPDIVSTSTTLKSVPAHLGHDIKIFPVSDIIADSGKVLPTKNGCWIISSYSKSHKYF